MAQRVAAIFPSREAAERAGSALIHLGADREHVSMLARGDEGALTTKAATERWNETSAPEQREHTDFVEPAREVGDAGAPLTTADDEDAARGAAAGAGIGAVVGLAAGAAALMVPGFGIVMAAGPLAWALGGAAGAAAAGAIAGGVYGGLRDIGIEEPYARGYEERVRSGDVLLTALVPSIAEERVLDILAEHGAEDISFADDTPIAQMDTSAAETRIEGEHYRTTSATDRGGDIHRPASSEPAVRDLATAAPADAGEAAPTRSEYTPGASADRGVTDTVPSAVTDQDYHSQQQEAKTASWAESPVGGASTTGAAFDVNPNIARGEARQAEGEREDRAADRTASPFDDLAARRKPLEGQAQKERGAAEETTERRKP